MNTLPWKQVLSKNKKKYQIVDKNQKVVADDIDTLEHALYIRDCCNNTLSYVNALGLLKNDAIMALGGEWTVDPYGLSQEAKDAFHTQIDLITKTLK